MSESQETQQQNKNEPQANTTSKNRNRKNRRKRSKGSAPIDRCEANELDCAAGDSTGVVEKKPLHTSMEQLQVAHKPLAPIASRKDAGSNWEAVANSNHQDKQKTSEEENVDDKGEENRSEKPTLSKSARHRQKRRAAEKKYIAMDCEMVGVGINGQDDMLARVSVVSKRGEVLLDKFVKPQEAVTNYRTSVSGIRPHDINNGEDFKSVQEEVVQMLQGKILVGHAIRNDLAVLRIKHPDNSTRDTSRYKPLCRMVTNGRTPSLKRLTQAILGKEIQTGEHNSVEDARAAMSIYNTLAREWEAYLRRRQQKTGK